MNAGSGPGLGPHGYSFDPTHGYTLEELLEVEAPGEPAGFVSFWKEKREKALRVLPDPRMSDTGQIRNGWRVYDLVFRSTGDVQIRGWVLVPVGGNVRRGFVVGHGYGGREAPDFDLPFEESVLVFPCARGLGRSRVPKISEESHWHVLHEIENRDRYILGGCVEDLWLSVSALLGLFPKVRGHVGYLGESFGGGIGALGLPWEERVAMAHIRVPTFGNQPLRLALPSTGSAASVQIYAKRKPAIAEVLAFFDSAISARHMQKPTHCACALFDPAVAPAGQFSIYNALGGPKSLFVLSSGHHSHPHEAAEAAQLRQEIHNFFRDI